MVQTIAVDFDGVIHAYTNRKLPAVAYVDDRGIRFESWQQTLHDLEVFYG